MVDRITKIHLYGTMTKKDKGYIILRNDHALIHLEEKKSVYWMRKLLINTPKRLCEESIGGILV